MKKNAIDLALLATLILCVAALVFPNIDAFAQNVLNYNEQGGARRVIGGSLDVVSGGDLDIESGGAFKIAGTTVTSTAAELNSVDGATATATELNFLAGVTAGTRTVSKAIVVDASGTIDAIDVTALSVGTTLVTSTAAELNILDGVTSTAAQLNTIEQFPGAMASAVVDFNATGEAAMSVTVDGVVYLEADAEDLPNGVWTNGASANDSATSLIAAINGDTRAAVPFTALVGVDTDAVTLFWDAIGTAGNVTISTTSGANCTAAALKQITRVTHTVTTQGLLSGAVEIPVPFTPTGFSFVSVSSSGLQKAITDLATIQASPARIRFDTDGATNLANTDVVYLTAWQ